MQSADIVVIGGGMAGAAVAYELAVFGSVIVLERERLCGYHATGRSAASFTENYGNLVIRRLAKASRAFLESPPPGFSEHPLLGRRGMLTIGRTDQKQLLEEELSRALEFVPTMRRVSVDEAIAMVPALRRDYLDGAILEPFSMDIDVHSLHHGFLKGLKGRGGMVVTDAEAARLTRRADGWSVATRAGDFKCEILVNAAGAWADQIAAMAGAEPVGLIPRRRTVVIVDPSAGLEIDRWPLVNDVASEFYFKPDAKRLLLSPGDATPAEPGDAQPEELDVAIGIDRLERATTIEVLQVHHRWAGLRTFASDGSPVVGFDPQARGLFWLAGQGGYGIKTASALAHAAASLIVSDRLPEDLQQLGLAADDLAPVRLRRPAVRRAAGVPA